MSEWKGCTKSHPHEDMSEECEFKTEQARTINKLANELALTNQKLEFAEAIIAGNNVLLSENVAAQLHIKELREAVIAMVEDGWLYYGTEGMSEAQEKCLKAYRRVTPNV